jgi:hypothetical protein
MEPVEGTLVFCHTTGIIGRAIRLAERLRWHGGAFYNHVAIIDRVENGIAYVIQAEAKGVTNDKRLDEIAPNGHYVLVPMPAGVDTASAIRFARQEVGAHYGYLSILSTLLDILTPIWFVAFRRKDSWFCSALVAEALRAGGWLWKWADVYSSPTPASLWLALQNA